MEVNMKSLCICSGSYIKEPVIVDSQRKSVTYCIGWVEKANPKSGYIERTGVYTDFIEK